VALHSIPSSQETSNDLPASHKTMVLQVFAQLYSYHSTNLIEENVGSRQSLLSRHPQIVPTLLLIGRLTVLAQANECAWRSAVVGLAYRLPLRLLALRRGRAGGSAGSVRTTTVHEL